MVAIQSAMHGIAWRPRPPTDSHWVDLLTVAASPMLTLHAPCAGVGNPCQQGDVPDLPSTRCPCIGAMIRSSIQRHCAWVRISVSNLSLAALSPWCGGKSGFVEVREITSGLRRYLLLKASSGYGHRAVAHVPLTHGQGSTYLASNLNQCLSPWRPECHSPFHTVAHRAWLRAVESYPLLSLCYLSPPPLRSDVQRRTQPTFRVVVVFRFASSYTDPAAFVCKLVSFGEVRRPPYAHSFYPKWTPYVEPPGLRCPSLLIQLPMSEAKSRSTPFFYHSVECALGGPRDLERIGQNFTYGELQGLRDQSGLGIRQMNLQEACLSLGDGGCVRTSGCRRVFG
ncbi:hypothetical protein VNO77_26930 [Canavalia gladiata]|uniref:Uncharacterized protein n=1 Tax=Canavalia gladiata TaxID=3824 RepID=A0AAN9KTR2_CANGL